jgi:hypothetical protein
MGVNTSNTDVATAKNVARPAAPDFLKEGQARASL